MIFTGTLVNGAAIALCGAGGAYVIKNVPERYNDILIKAVGLAVLFIGISGALENKHIMLLIMSMVIGSLIGEWIDIDGKMNRFGKYIERKLGFGEGNFSKGFVSSSILFCTGAMAIVGAMNSGLLLDHNMLYAKSILDGVIALVFAGTMGAGVAFSSIPVILYEGIIAVTAAFAGNFMPTEMISEMSAAGSLIIAGIGFNFLGMKPIKVANMIPAMFIPCVYFAGMGIFNNIIA